MVYKGYLGNPIEFPNHCPFLLSYSFMQLTIHEHGKRNLEAYYFFKDINTKSFHSSGLSSIG